MIVRKIMIMILAAVLLAGCVGIVNADDGDPAASLTADKETGTAPLTVMFTISGTNITNYTIDFGDESTKGEHEISTTSVTHDFREAGTFTVTLKPFNRTTGIVGNTKTMEITVESPKVPDTAQPAIISFDKSPTSGITTATEVTFTFTATDAASFEIDFGEGGGNVSAPNGIKHTYSTAGTYTALLTAINGTKNITQSLPVIVEEEIVPLKADITASPTSGSAPLTVSFSADDSTGNPDSYLWDFDDKGLTSPQPNPEYTFTESGTYNVILTIKKGDNTTNATKIITVSDPISSVIITGLSAPAFEAAPDKTATSDTNNVNVESIEWTTTASTFAANTAYTATIVLTTSTGYKFNQTPSVKLNGNFLASSEITRTSDSKLTVKHTFPKTASAILPTITTFSATPTSGNSPLLVTFTYLVTNATSVSLEYGDGNKIDLPISTTSRSASYSYTTAKSYTATLNATNNNGHTTKTLTIKVEGLKASFTASPSSGSAPLGVKFTDSSTGNIKSRTWDFGDGSLADTTSTNPVHTYTKAGKYVVTLTVSDGTATDPIQRTITVTEDTSSASGTAKTATTVTSTNNTSESLTLNLGDIPSPFAMIKEFVQLFLHMLEPGNYIIFANNTTAATK